MDTTAVPRYASHKEVHALKITSLEDHRHDTHPGSMGGILGFAPFECAPVEVSRQWMRAHDPHVGGFYIIYPGGYTSFSPATAFHEGYTLIGGRTAPMTRQDLIDAAQHFKTQRNAIRDALIGFLDLPEPTIDGVNVFAAAVRQNKDATPWDLQRVLNLVEALLPTMDDPRMAGRGIVLTDTAGQIVNGHQPQAQEAAPSAASGVIVDAQYLGAGVSVPDVSVEVPDDEPVSVQAHAQNDAQRGMGLFIPAPECAKLATSLASMADFAQQTGSYPRMKAVFRHLVSIINSKVLVEEEAGETKQNPVVCAPRGAGHDGPCAAVQDEVNEQALANHARHITANTVDYGWVVEKGDTGAPQYLTFGEGGYDFSTDNLAAVRFARQRDATDAMEFVAGTCGKDLEPMRVAEHSWS